MTAGEGDSKSDAPSTAVIQLWTEVGNGIDKNQTVVWKSAVESLDHAGIYLATSPEARVFVEKYMTQIIGILVEQQPAKIGMHERTCVQDSLALAVAIVAQDLKIQKEQNGECMLLNALAHILNKKKAFYKGNKGGVAWNVNHLVGLPEVRVKNIDRFRAAGGFKVLEQYLLQKISTNSFPKLDSLHHVLVALTDTIPVRELGPDQAAAVKETEDDAIAVAKAVMKYINSLSDEDLKKLSTELLGNVQHDLQKIFDKLVSSRRDSTNEFYAFWRNLILNLITSKSLPLKLFGWEQVGDLIEACNEHKPPPKSYMVTNAGCTFVNGVYEYAGPVTKDGYARLNAEISYMRKIPDTEENGAGKKLTLFRCTMRSQQKWWFLSEADEEQPGTDRDIDYYQHKSKEHEEAAPPPGGWITCRASGVDPPPTLQARGVLVPPGFEYSTLEHQLAKWAIENEIVEQVLGDSTIHREVVARSTVLIKFLASMCSTDPDASNEADKYALQASHLLFAWKTCTRKADAAVSLQVYQLLVSILPLCPGRLAIPLLSAIQVSLKAGDNKRDYLFEVSEFCAALASANLPDAKNPRGTPAFSEEVRAEVLNLLWSVLLHPESSSLKSYDLLKMYVTHELQGEKKSGPHRKRFLGHCVVVMSENSSKRGNSKVNEVHALRMVKLTHFVLVACPRLEAENVVLDDGGALPLLVFRELTAYLERRNNLVASKGHSALSDSSLLQHQEALNQRLKFLRHIYGLSNSPSVEPISMSADMLEELWELCKVPEDREACMVFIASASARGKAEDYGRPEVVAPETNVAKQDQLLSPAFADDVCFSAFLKLFCSPSFLYESLGDAGYRSFQSLFKRIRLSAIDPALKKDALDALWRICLLTGTDAVASRARKDLLSVYAEMRQTKLAFDDGVEQMDTGGVDEEFRGRMFICLQKVQTEVEARLPQSRLSSERCLRVLNEAIGQCNAEIPLTTSVLARLADITPSAAPAEIYSLLPHGMRGKGCCRRIGVVVKRPAVQNHMSGVIAPPGAKPPSTAKFSLDVHPFETLASLKQKVAARCNSVASFVKPVQINGRISAKGQRFSGNLNVNVVPDNTVMDELGVVDGCEVVMRLAERTQAATSPGVPMRLAERSQAATTPAGVPGVVRRAIPGDLSDVFFADGGSTGGKLFEMLLSILESLQSEANEMVDKEGSSLSTVRQLVWDLLLAMPTNDMVVEHVKFVQSKGKEIPSHPEDAMEVDSMDETWSQLLDPRRYDRSVYTLLTIDAFLQPAPESLSTLPDGQLSVIERAMCDSSSTFRSLFIEAGGFDATVSFFSGLHDESTGGNQRKSTRGSAVALRVLTACLFKNSSSDSQGNDLGPSTPDDAGSQLLLSLSNAEGLLKSLIMMVVGDQGISSATIADVLRFLKLLFRSPEAAQGFLSLPNGMAERFLLILLLWDEHGSGGQTASSISSAMHVRKSAYELIIQTSLLADHALSWLINAISGIDASSECSSEFFNALEKLVSDRASTASNREVDSTELLGLGTAVCQKIVACPRPTKEVDIAVLPTNVLCGCLKLVRAVIETSGSAALKSGTNYLVDHFNVQRWSQKFPSSEVIGLEAEVMNVDAILVDLMGAVFDGLLSPGGASAIAVCCDKESRRRGFDVVGAAARRCQSDLGYLSLVTRMNDLMSTAAPQLRHRWHQFNGNLDSPSRSRNTSKYSGLRNQGCTCYMNSVLQQLLMMPELRKSMCSAKLPMKLRSSGYRGAGAGDELVGKKITLQWETGDSYTAVVEAFEPTTRMHTIRYLPQRELPAGPNAIRQDISKPPPSLPDEFILPEGRPGKETGVFEIVNEAEGTSMEDANGPVDESMEETEDEVSSRLLLEEVQRTFVHLEQGSRGRCFDPRALVEACACLRLEFDVWQQNDASEFATKLLDRLEITLKRWAPENFRYMDHTFGLKQTKQKICKECGLKTSREEKLLNIDCQIRGKSDINEALAANTEVEIMEGSNQVFCDSCKKKTDTVLRTAISTLPNMLILSLKRFDLDYSTFETVKLNSRCAFGQTLNLKPYTIESLEKVDESRDPNSMDTDNSQRSEADDLFDSADEDFEYRLAGVLVHAGVAQGGHYYSFIKDRDPQSDDKWYRFDDEDVSPFDPANIEAECFGGRVKKETKWPNGQVHTVEQDQFANALMLFYEKVRPTELARKDEIESKIPPTLHLTSGYDVFSPDVQSVNAVHKWQTFLFDTELQTFLKGLLGFCRLSSSSQYDGTKAAPTWKGPLVQMLLSFIFDVMMYSSDSDSFSVWAKMLEEILVLDAAVATAFVYDLARRTEGVSSNWLRTYLIDCPDQRLRSFAVGVFSAAIKSCSSAPLELDLLHKWSQAWKEQVNEYLASLVGQVPLPLKLQGKFVDLEDTNRIGQQSSCLGIIISHLNLLLEALPCCWKFNSDIFVLIRNLTSVSPDGLDCALRQPMIESNVPGRLLAIAARERTPLALRSAFPGASLSATIANSQIRNESNPVSHILPMAGSQALNNTDISAPRGPSGQDYAVLFEALLSLMGLKGMSDAPLVQDSGEIGRGRHRFALTEEAIQALTTVFDENCTQGAPGLGQHELESHLRRCAPNGALHSQQKIHDLLTKYPSTSGIVAAKNGNFLSLDGFLAYYRDCVQSNDLRLRGDLHAYGFRPDLSRRSRPSRLFRVEEREYPRSPAESVAFDVVEMLQYRPLELGRLVHETLACTFQIYSLAYSVSEALMQYLVAAAVYRKEVGTLTSRVLQMIYQTPNDWNGNETVNACTTALQVIATLPGDDQDTRISHIMKSNTKAARNVDYRAGLLQVLAASHRLRSSQHYSNDVHWTFARYMAVLKELHALYPVSTWMNSNSTSWSFIERELLDSRPAPVQSGQMRPLYENTMRRTTPGPFEHNTDDEMGGIGDSEEEDDEDSQYENTIQRTTNDGPYQVVVEGAGNPAANGVYNQDGFLNKTCRYAMEGRWNGRRHRFLIFQCNVSNNTKHWYISIVPLDQSPGTSADIDFYTAPMNAECEHVPPKRGWVTAAEGAEPAPTLFFQEQSPTMDRMWNTSDDNAEI